MSGSADIPCTKNPKSHRSVLKKDGIEYDFIGKLQGLKYDYRPDITDRAKLEQNFREKFEALKRVRLTDAAFARLLLEVVTDSQNSTRRCWIAFRFRTRESPNNNASPPA